VVLLAEGLKAGVECGHARVEALGVEVAAFECLVVALDRVLGAAGFLREAGALLGEGRAVRARLGSQIQ
jgi:hypothetical protein